MVYISGSWINRIRSYKPGIKLIEALISQSTIVRENKVVIKDFTHALGLFKWNVLGNLYRLGYPFTTNPTERMLREVKFFLCFGMESNEISVPKIYSFDLDKHILVREFVKGNKLVPEEKTDDAYKLGNIIGIVHSYGWTLGDTKSDNFVIDPNGKPYIIDAEQAEKVSKDFRLRAWDILLSLLFVSLRKPYMSQGDYEEKVSMLLKGYSEGANPAMLAETIRGISSPSVLVLFPLFPWHHLKVIKEHLTFLI